MEKPKILVVDDEECIREILQFNLEIEGYDVDTAPTPSDALSLILKSYSPGGRHYSLIILDVMMDEMSGFKFAHKLKKNEETANIPIIFCSAKDSEDDKVTGLTIGADDYVTKPFSVREMVARVKNIIKRHIPNNEDNITIAASKGKLQENSNLNSDLEGKNYPQQHNINRGLEINTLSKSCTIGGMQIPLTKKEFSLLELFTNNKGRIYSRDELLRLIWENDVIVTYRTIDVTIARLRKKIGEYGKFIITRQGFGYGYSD